MSKYQNKIVFVTGGSEGIGKEIAHQFVLEGANVVVMSRSSQKLSSALKEIESARKSASQKILSQTIDVTNWNETDKTLNRLVSEHGVPDYLVNCAGSARPGYIQDLEVEHFKNMMDLNYFGLVHVCKALVPHFIKARKGHIVNTSSMAGFIGLFGYTGYCASKFAAVGFSEALLREVENFGVSVSVLCPPNTKTPGLEEENKYKPAEVLKVEEKAKPVDAIVVAQALLKALPSRRFFIHPTFDGSLAHGLSRFLPVVLKQFTKRPKSLSN